MTSFAASGSAPIAGEYTVDFTVFGTGEAISLTNFVAIVAGYTGRDAAAVQHHIDELAAIGVAPPPAIPMFYPVEATSLSQCDTFALSGTQTSGEIEPLYVRHNGQYFLGIASDHTDRRLETKDIGASKRACPKPVGAVLIPLGRLGEAHLDRTALQSRVDGVDYQLGTMESLRAPADLLSLLESTDLVGDSDYVCLGGTVPLLDGTFVYGSTWELSLTLPNGVNLNHSYYISEGN